MGKIIPHHGPLKGIIKNTEFTEKKKENSVFSVRSVVTFLISPPVSVAIYVAAFARDS